MKPVPPNVPEGAMVLGTFQEWRVGQVLNQSLRDCHGNPHEAQPFLVLAEATHDDWVKCLAACGVTPDGPSYPGRRFYFVSLD